MPKDDNDGAGSFVLVQCAPNSCLANGFFDLKNIEQRFPRKKKNIEQRLG